MTKIESREALRTLYKPAHGRSVAKEIHVLDRHCRHFIALSPFVLLATGGADGSMDVSPRGDQPGFVAVEDDTTLLLPDRPGNNRLDSLENILERPGVGLLFLIPGVDETLRVNGRAEIHADAALCARFAVAGKLPASVLKITVDSAYLHCAKSLMRSALWSQDAQIARSALPTMGEMLKDHAGLEAPPETQEEMLRRYASVLY
ncbi:pyridoxamine 5'-phosphate oxidase family protein [Roseixanthobacter glucoisosaccharinicivorans]|uniref:pyridoxamine 5'-phosphate oxidase family protein n=1 Tax=Roseixanthobacter glucoisosaccharinicivorans TaxID=3119923 RepID=UPI003728CC1D